MTDTTAKIRAKGLDSTGVTEPIAEQMYAHKGRHYMAIVELEAVERHEKADGGRRVDLVIETIEPAEHGSELDKHLRDLASAAYAKRSTDGAQAAIDDTLVPSLGDAVKAGARHGRHPFLPTDAADDNGTCEVCGLSKAETRHITSVADPFTNTGAK